MTWKPPDLLPILVGLLISIITAQVCAQNPDNPDLRIPNGITLHYGVGPYAVTDEYISAEKYTGTVPYFHVDWLSRHVRHVYEMALEFGHASDVSNFNVTTDIIEFSLRQSFLYPVMKFSLLAREVHLFAGPSTELFLFSNEQNIAVSGFDYSHSIAALLSLGVGSRLFYPVGDRFVVESSLDVNAVSLGLRMVDDEETDASPVKPLSPIAGIHAAFGLGVRYYLLDWLSVAGAYHLRVTRIGAWDPLLAVSDAAALSLTVGF